jgi:hypothetical protein
MALILGQLVRRRIASLLAAISVSPFSDCVVAASREFVVQLGQQHPTLLLPTPGMPMRTMLRFSEEAASVATRYYCPKKKAGAPPKAQPLPTLEPKL